jgi:hypothetical protein
MMAIYEATARFFGRPVTDYDKREGLSDPQGHSYRVSLGYDENDDGEKNKGLLSFLSGGGPKKSLTFEDKLEQLAADPNSSRLEALLIGSWGDTYDNSSGVVINSLVKARDKFPALRALFIGDMISEECEISWIKQSDISPLYSAYPNLEWLQIRGGEGLKLGEVHLPHLRGLVIETGGLGKDVLTALAKANLPELEHLELWLGTDDYGWDGTVEDLEPLLRGSQFPKLRYLGLRNFEEVDALASRLVVSPVVSTVEVIDLSLGNLSDQGGKELLKLPTNARLKLLDLHHHYLSEELIAQLARMPFQVNVKDRQEADEDDGEEYRYIAVSE